MQENSAALASTEPSVTGSRIPHFVIIEFVVARASSRAHNETSALPLALTDAATAADSLGVGRLHCNRGHRRPSSKARFTGH